MKRRSIGVAALVAAALAAAALAAYALPIAPTVPLTGGQGPRFRLVEVPGGPQCVVLYWRIGHGLAVSCNWEKKGE